MQFIKTWGDQVSTAHSSRERAKGQTVYYYTHALLDSGSTKTFCSDALIEKLGVKGQQVNLSLTSVNSRENADVEVGS